jgi:chromosome segregation protein
MDLGASFKGHGILEQGKVDELVTASPQERRTIIEETAGITKYKVRKAEAERKLEATQQNLLRVRDIITEVKRQLNHLERQAKKAKTYQDLREEIRNLELRLSVQEGCVLSESLNHTQSECIQLQTQEAQLLTQRAGQEAEVESLRVSALEQQRLLEDLKQSLHQMDSQILGAEHKMAALTAQQKEWQDQSAHLEAEIKQLEEALQDGQSRIEEQTQQAQLLEREATAHRSQLTELDAQAQALEFKIREGGSTLQATRAQVFDHHAGMTQTKNKMTEGELRTAEIHRRMERAVSQQEQLGQERSKLHEDITQQEQVLATHRQEINQVRGELNNKQDQFRLLQESCTKLEGSLTSQRHELQDKKVRQGVLLDQIQRHLSLQEGARELLTMKGPGQLAGFHGVLADLLDTQAGYEKALEAILRERLSGLVMEGNQAMASALEVLKSQGAGEATFIPRHPKLTLSHQVAETKARALKESQKGILGDAISFVRVKEGDQTILQALLQDVLVIENLDFAFNLWEAGVWGGTFVTLDGEVLEPSGILYGHSPRTEKKGLLQERRDVKILEEAIHELEQEVAALEQEHHTATERLKDLTTQIEGLGRHLHALELEEVEWVKKVEFLQQDLHRIEDNLRVIGLEQQQATQEEQEIQDQIRELSATLEEQSRQKSSLETSLQGQQDTLVGLGIQKETLQSAITQLKITLTGFQEKQANTQVQQEQLNRHLSEQKEQRLSKRQRLNQLVLRQQTALREMEELVRTIQRFSGQRLSLVSQIQSQTETASDTQERLKTLEGSHRLCRSELEEVQRRVRENEVRLAETKMRLDQIRQVVDSLSHLTLEQAIHSLKIDGSDEASQPSGTGEEAKNRLTELKTRLETMEPVNLAALNEHRELAERYQFLTQQEQDLTQSIDSLLKAIARVNQTIQSLFLETFESLNAKFGEVFTQFFEGGSAKLVLLDTQNPLESGLEIVAQPPGKRLRHIQLLSGGEKALTAISLLFSSFLIHPGPFCVLDEIDAALDEENVRRFTRVLRSLSEWSQFILITHNKRTMEMADVLYGVTMEEPGTSKLISVKMAEVAS